MNMKYITQRNYVDLQALITEIPLYLSKSYLEKVLTPGLRCSKRLMVVKQNMSKFVVSIDWWSCITMC